MTRHRCCLCVAARNISSDVLKHRQVSPNSSQGSRLPRDRPTHGGLSVVKVELVTDSGLRVPPVLKATHLTLQLGRFMVAGLIT